MDVKSSMHGKSFGIIAGGGQFPLMAAESVRKQGYRIVAVAHEGETDPKLEEKVDSISWIKLGQLGKLIKNLKREGVEQALMAGTIKKRRMFEGIRPDLRVLAIMSKLAVFHDDGILKTVADELEAEGIEIVSSTAYLPELSAPPGCLTKKTPNKSQKKDIEFGWKMGKELGKLDIGQCVVVRNKTVLAVEAIEGTDEAILRGGMLAREKAVVVKLSKPLQDMRFDVPTVGINTLKIMLEVNASVLAIESGKTLIFDKEKMLQLADDSGICIISCETDAGGRIRGINK